MPTLVVVSRYPSLCPVQPSQKIFTVPAAVSTKPTAPVPANISGEAAKIGVAAAEVADKVLLTDDKASLVESDDRMSQEEYARQVLCTPWQLD